MKGVICMEVSGGCRCREKRAKKSGKPGCFCGKRSVAGILCIVSGILVMICFVPGWLVAIIAAFILFSLGFCLLGMR